MEQRPHILEKVEGFSGAEDEYETHDLDVVLPGILALDQLLPSAYARLV